MLGALFEMTLSASTFWAGIFSLMLSLAFGPGLIRWLRWRFTERIASDSVRLNELHAAKKDTPTMGGLLIAGTTIASILCIANVSSIPVWIFCLTIASLSILGATDDWIKLRTTRKGISARQKLSFQCLIASAAAAGIYLFQRETGGAGKIGIPGTAFIFHVGWSWIPWAAFVIVGASNAVNLTDGLDGLASGCAAITSIALAIVICCGTLISFDSDCRQAASVSCAALAGSTVGFLWWNRHPAKIFMGDTGSLPIGGLLAVAALATGTELLLAIIGAVFVAETLSVILQVGWYRRTRTRILLCSPLHNHFVFRGVPERRIVAGFWVAAMCSALIGMMAAFW